MTQRDRIRRAAILCCHCVRNVAYYRAGWTNGAFSPEQDFWRNANSNFLDIAVLEWCKLFSELKGKHHWRKVVPAPEEFMTALQAGIGVTQEAFEAHQKEMRLYRNKFVAHLDQLPVAQIPRLTVAVDSTVFLYTVLRGEYPEFLGDAPQNLEEFYETRYEHGRGCYPDAT